MGKQNILGRMWQKREEKGRPLITLLRASGYFMRTIAGVVIVTFLSLILTPTGLVMRTAMAAEAPAPVPATEEGKLSKAILKVQKHLGRMEQKLAAGQDDTEEFTALQQLRTELTQLDVSVSANFQQVKDLLQAKNLPEIIHQRHQAMVDTYQAELAILLANLQAIEQAAESTVRKQKAQAANAHLKAKKQKQAQQPFDPDNLPNKSRKADPTNKPKKSRDEFLSAKLFDTPFVKLAALGDFTFDKLAGASDPAYLAETDEIVLTQAIQDKAAELNHDPVKIYHWVRNNIEWQPNWGAVQDAPLTLEVKRGNAMDIASLTIALLRASGIPSRYIHGTIEVPAVRFMNWAGGFTDANAAADFAQSGGIPTGYVTTGGQVSHIQIEHIWVEAATDYHPSRGAVNRDADSWTAMDPSYKQYEYLQGLDAAAISGIDPEQLAQNFINSGTINETEGWVTGFDPTILQNAQTQAQQNLEAYITNNMTDPTVGDVIGGRKTIIKEYPVLPSSLPNLIVTEGARYDKLPGQLQQQVTYGLGIDLISQPVSPVTLPWAKVNNRKVTLSFKPATENDELALQALLPEGEITDISQLPGSIPSYLINVIPELKIDGQTVASGNAMQLGEDLDFFTRIQFAGRSNPAPYIYKVKAGSFLSVNAVAANVSPQKLQTLQAKLEQTRLTLETNDQAQIAALTREDILGDMFYTGTLGYFAQLTALGHIAGLAQGGHSYLAAGYGTLGYEPNVSYFFGFPMAIEPGGVSLDIPIETVTAVNDGDHQKRINFIFQVGILSSALEHAVPEQMFADPTNPPDAISAVKALSKASAAGQRIYHITPANQATILPNINHNALGEITAALNAGKEVITHTDAVSVPGWSGAGYIIFDPETGDGAYKISGGNNGSFLFIAIGIIMFAAAMIIAWGMGGILGSILLGWEILGFFAWTFAIGNAKTPQEFMQANAGAFIIAFMGFLTPIFAAISFEAVAALWFSILTGTALTNPFNWFY